MIEYTQEKYLTDEERQTQLDELTAAMKQGETIAFNVSYAANEYEDALTEYYRAVSKPSLSKKEMENVKNMEKELKVLQENAEAAKYPPPDLPISFLGNTPSISSDNEEHIAEDYAEFLRDNNIAASPAVYSVKDEEEGITIKTIPGKCVVRNEDAERADALRSAFAVTKGHVICSREELMPYAEPTPSDAFLLFGGDPGEKVPNTIKTMSGLDETLIALTVYNAPYTNHAVGIDIHGGQMDLCYLPSQEEEVMEGLLMNRAFEIANPEKAREITDAFMWKVQSREDMKRMPTAAREDFVVGIDGKEYPYAVFNARGIVYCADEESPSVFVSRTDKNFKTMQQNLLHDFDNPVVMRKEDFVINTAEREKVLEKKYHKKVPSPETVAEMKAWRESSLKIQSQFRERSQEIQNTNDHRHFLSEIKMAFFDNTEQREISSALTNEFVSYSEFYAHQMVNDGHDVEEKWHANIGTLKSNIEAHIVSEEVVPDIDEVVKDAGDMVREENIRQREVHAKDHSFFSKDSVDIEV